MSAQEQTPPPTSSAELCRSRGWGVGTVLEGEWIPGDGLLDRARRYTHRVVITAVGEQTVLGREIAVKRGNSPWEEIQNFEHGWCFLKRDWRKVEGGPQGAEEEAEGEPWGQGVFEVPVEREVIFRGSDLAAELELLRAFAAAHEAWEANLVLSNEAWGGGKAEFPGFTCALWDEALAVQALRNKASAARQQAAEPPAAGGGA